MTNRVLLGDLGGGDYGLKVSKPRFNVLSSGTKDKKLAFDSNATKTMRLFVRDQVTLANRVLLDSDGLKLSKPGTNVLTAGNSGLLFSSEWSQLGLFSSGSMTIGWVTSDNIVGNWEDSISFGKTFDTVPLANFALDFTSGAKRLPVGTPPVSSFTSMTVAIPTSGNLRLRLHGTTTGIEFAAVLQQDRHRLGRA